MLTYLCKYTPVEMMAGFGVTMDAPNEEVADFAYSDTMIHSATCAHARMLITSMRDLRRDSSGRSADSCCRGCDRDSAKSELILTTCCDSIRRVADTVADGDFDFFRMLDLPHRGTGHGAELYTSELLRLIRAYEEYSGRTFRRDVFLAEWRKASERRNSLFPEDRPFLILLGARAGDLLLLKIRDGLPLPVVNLTCGGDRVLPPPPEDAESLPDEELISRYAAALLGQLPCMRMADVGDRAAVLRQKNLAGIIYHTVRFCDFYPFEYAQIRRGTNLPILKIESDYTDQSAGQLSTRIAAFGESLAAAHRKSDRGRKAAGRKHTMNRHALFVGIDSGSTTTNIAAVDADGNLIASLVLRTGAKASSAAERAYAGLREKLGARAADITAVTATGYGREFISFADSTKTEISCHARGALSMAPRTRTIIDIGGQDSKVIVIGEDGNVANFIMNDKCAAGTGRFLEMMANVLELSLDEMSEKGLSWKKDLTISSTCTVFAESEVVSLIAESCSTADIVHALNKSVAAKTCAMVRRSRGTGPFLMTGGVANNRGVVHEIEERLGEKLFVGEHPDLAGAIGAALFARDEAPAE